MVLRSFSELDILASFIRRRRRDGDDDRQPTVDAKAIPPHTWYDVVLLLSLPPQTKMELAQCIYFIHHWAIIHNGHFCGNSNYVSICRLQ